MIALHGARPGAGSVRAWVRFASAVRADHDMLRHYDGKYTPGQRPPGPLAKDLVQRLGFQMMVAYRLMRLFAEAGVPLAPQVMGRLIRLFYGADIHYDARFAEGVVIVHGMGIAVSHAARVGSGVILSQNVTLGDGIDPQTRAAGAPTLEDGVHVGPGVTIFGPITVGARSKIMPGAVVWESVPHGSLVETPAPRVVPRRAPSGEA
jgi:serine acetyltransferase